MVFIHCKKNIVCGKSINIPTYSRQENEWPILVFKAMFRKKLSLLFDHCHIKPFKVYKKKKKKKKNTTKKEFKPCIRRFFEDCKLNGLAKIFRSVGYTNVLLRFLKDQYFVTYMYVTNIFERTMQNGDLLVFDNTVEQ